MNETDGHTPEAAYDEAAAGVPGDAEGELVLDLDGFEGPIDLLLTLSREQKVDLAKISILALADQYLAFIARTRQIRLEVAADYLVMAAWLAFLKSRLLLPDEHEADQPTGQQMADALAFQLKRLESMQAAGQALFARPIVGRDLFPRGAPEGIKVVTEAAFELSLYELLKAYGQIRSRETDATLHIAAQDLYSVEQAFERLRSLLGSMPDWADLSAFLPEGLASGIHRRSAIASTFAATLELVRQGRAEVRQDGAFHPIYIRARNETGNTD